MGSPSGSLSGVVYKFQFLLCNESYYGECIRHLNVRVGKYIRVSPFTKRQARPKNRSVANNLLFCNHSASYDNSSILTRDIKKCFTRIEGEPVNN